MKVMKLCYFNLSFCSGYFQLSSLKSKMFHKILVNENIQTDFTKLTSNDAYQLACFWCDELAQANTEESFTSQGINLLYRPTKHVFEKSINLTDFKYNIVSDVEHEQQYYIWRPKIQICLPSPYSTKIDEQDDDISESDDNKCRGASLYPSLRETMYLLSLNMKDRSKPVIINKSVQSPYWNEPKYDSFEILQNSLQQFFVVYLKYPGVNTKNIL